MTAPERPSWRRCLQRLLADRLVLCPTRDVIDAGCQTRHMICRDGLQIECFVHRTGGGLTGDRPEHGGGNVTDEAALPELLVIKLPGTAGRGERSTPQPADLLPHWRGEVWTWNPPGYGRSTGRLSLASIPTAAAIFYDDVIGRRCGPETRVWIVGNSLGCATALHLASQRQPHGLILRNPPPLTEVIPHVAARRRPRWVSAPLARLIAAGVPDEMNALLTAPRAHGAALFLQSEADALIPPSLQTLVRQVYAGPQRLIRLDGLNHHQPLEERHLRQLRDGVAWLATAVAWPPRP